jgi:hypothetical protein
MKYVKKPVVIEAIQFNSYADLNRMCNSWGKLFMDVADFDEEEKENFFIETLEGNMCVIHGDFVIKGIKGEFYPCKPDIFYMSYEEFK